MMKRIQGVPSILLANFGAALLPADPRLNCCLWLPDAREGRLAPARGDVTTFARAKRDGEEADRTRVIKRRCDIKFILRPKTLN